AESLGVRSMCTFVETPDIRILLDAGVSLCPNRFGLPPHPLEFKAIENARRKIVESAEKAEIVTLSHYHFDHHTPSYEDWLCNWTAKDETAKQIYEGKIVLIKNPKEKINFSQRRRGWIFQKTGGKYAKKLEIADGKTFLFGKATQVRFSEPVFHGSENSALGWILMTTIEYESEKFMFAPDVQGPMALQTLEIIKREKPQLIMIGGPPFYLARFKVEEKQIQTGMKLLERVIEFSQMVILEHHILRDEGWREKAKSIFEKAQEVGCKVLTAAEFLREENAFLEAVRKRLYAENPPSREFEKWMNVSMTVKKSVKPPI
ncbi:MAG: MBL fold metallo-hydrolase, partial [Candidatus Bathycorpusculaceae bacterium]